jgi:hypothetical protein
MLANAEASNTNTSGGKVIAVETSSKIASFRHPKPRRTVLR